MSHQECRNTRGLPGRGKGRARQAWPLTPACRAGAQSYLIISSVCFPSMGRSSFQASRGLGEILCEWTLTGPLLLVAASAPFWGNCCTSYSNQVVLVETRWIQAKPIRILLAFPWAPKTMAPEETIQERRNPTLRGAESREEGPGSIPMPDWVTPECDLRPAPFVVWLQCAKFPLGRCISFLGLL